MKDRREEFPNPDALEFGCKTMIEYSRETTRRVQSVDTAIQDMLAVHQDQILYLTNELAKIYNRVAELEERIDA